MLVGDVTLDNSLLFENHINDVFITSALMKIPIVLKTGYTHSELDKMDNINVIKLAVISNEIGKAEKYLAEKKSKENAFKMEREMRRRK